MRNAHKRSFGEEAKRTIEWFGHDMERVGYELRLNAARILREAGPDLVRAIQQFAGWMAVQAGVIDRALAREGKPTSLRPLPPPAPRYPARVPARANTMPGFPQVPRPAF